MTKGRFALLVVLGLVAVVVVTSKALVEPAIRAARQHVVDQVSEKVVGDMLLEKELDRVRSRLPGKVGNLLLLSAELSEDGGVQLRYQLPDLSDAQREVLMTSDVLDLRLASERCDLLGTDNLFDTIRDHNRPLAVEYVAQDGSPLRVVRTGFGECDRRR